MGRPSKAEFNEEITGVYGDGGNNQDAPAKNLRAECNCRCCGTVIKVTYNEVKRFCACHKAEQTCWVCAHCPYHCKCAVAALI